MNNRIIGLFFCGILLAGCASNSGPQQGISSTGMESETTLYKIGAIAPISGPAANYGEDAANAYKHAISQFNSENKNIQLELIMEDGKCNGKDAISAAQKLINVDQVDVIVGGICSAETLAAGNLAQNSKTLMISPLSSSPDVSDIGDYVFRFYNDIDQTQAIIDYLDKSNAQKVALVYQNTDYAVALTKTFKSNYQGEIILEEKFNSEEKDMGIIAKKIADNLENVDIVVFVPQDDNTFLSLLQAADNEGIIATLQNKMIGTETTYSTNLLENASELLQGHKVTQFPPLNSLGSDAQTFIADFTASHEIKFSEELLALDREAIALAIDALLHNAENPVEYLQQITAQNPRNGYFGEYYFDAEGDAVGLQFFVNKVVGNELVIAE